MKKIFIFLLLILSNAQLFSQNCTVNAGSNATICGTTHTLSGSVGSNAVGNPGWTVVSKPAGAPDPTISNINSYTPNVTGMTYPGNYVFSISQTCTLGTTSSQVPITAPGGISSHRRTGYYRYLCSDRSGNTKRYNTLRIHRFMDTL